ncbi:S49 family peptidase [Pontibacter sp. JAM-7]|uniref:S49 family peptidase n=1 Tax=Pontibacter sp. JAM-7 TaxID=3366581 RepID=UPI003AF859FC
MSDNPWNEPETNSAATAETPAKSLVEKAQAKAGNSREWKLIEKTLNGLFLEQRRARRWGIFFKSLTFLYLFALLGLLLVGNDLEQGVTSHSHTAVIEVKGTISADDEASADNIIQGLRDAFKAPNAQAVILRINSPGGSPVQAGYVYDEIKRLRALNPQKPLYAVITDIGASGAYYIAAAADEIYADKASLVGSIGVVSGGFGFVELMQKLGVERRLYTAGEHKAFLDPFSPSDQGEAALWQEVLKTTHAQFIEQVKQGRGDRLKPSPQLFSGLVWTGEQAVELGLVDGLASSSAIARDKVGAEQLVDYTPRPAPWKQVIGQLGISFAKAISTQLGLSPASPLR